VVCGLLKFCWNKLTVIEFWINKNLVRLVKYLVILVKKKLVDYIGKENYLII